MRKTSSLVIGPDEGISFWSPKPANGHVEIKVSPWNIPDTQHTVFLDEIPPGCHVGEHYHQQGTVEIFTILSGSGEILLDDEIYPLQPESVVYVHNESRHSLRNTGNVPLRFMVVITPTGLEDRFKAMGPEKRLNEVTPEPFDSLEHNDTHGVKKTSRYSE